MKSLFNKKSLSRIVYGGLILAISIAAWLLFKPKPVIVETGTVTKGTFIENFSIDGKVRSKTKVTIVAFTNGDIEEITLREGDTVKKGQTLTVLRWDYAKKIVSPLNGVIVKVYRKTAGPINRGEPLMDIIDPDDLEIVAEPLTTDAIRINENTKVQVLGLGDRKTVYSARVINVSRAGFIKVSALGVEEERTEVRMAFVDVPKEILQKIGDNFHVELSMELSRNDNVLKVPLGALFKDKESWAVYLIENGKARLKHIEISKRNDREALVSKGLQENNRVILFPGDTIFEGTSVKAK
ncbi:MAG: efflux RND transporter periplasmic adaptor subunit [Bdellovibrio sp.]